MSDDEFSVETVKKDLKKSEMHWDNAFAELKERCKEFIKFEAGPARRKTSCVFSVPKFLIGFPCFNAVNMGEALFAWLQSKNFNVMWISPDSIYIQWQSANSQKDKVRDPKTVERKQKDLDAMDSLKKWRDYSRNVTEKIRSASYKYSQQF
jgi:hypothetical protein